MLLLKPTGLSLHRPNCPRPAGILLRLLPGAIPRASHLIVDVTVTSMTLSSPRSGHFTGFSPFFSVRKLAARVSREVPKNNYVKAFYKLMSAKQVAFSNRVRFSAINLEILKKAFQLLLAQVNRHG
jgi:hypothetical protein